MLHIHSKPPPPKAGAFEAAVTTRLVPRTIREPVAGVDGTHSTVERAVTARIRLRTYTWQQEAVHDEAAVSGRQHCSIYTYNPVVIGWQWAGQDGVGVGVGVGHLKLRHHNWR
jgi:hypothetical protein